MQRLDRYAIAEFTLTHSNGNSIEWSTIQGVSVLISVTRTTNCRSRIKNRIIMMMMIIIIIIILIIIIIILIIIIDK